MFFDKSSEEKKGKKRRLRLLSSLSFLPSWPQQRHKKAPGKKDKHNIFCKKPAYRINYFNRK
jgi:hypothetical protein